MKGFFGFVFVLFIGVEFILFDELMEGFDIIV